MTTEPPPVPEASALAAKYASQIANKTVMITGVSPASIGSNLAVDLSAASPALVILTGRSAEKLSQTSKAITDAHPGVPVRTVLVDLGSIASVRKGAEEVLSWDDVPAIDVLVNNAGIMGVDYSLSEDGIEMQFAANHIGHFLLANLIMPKLLKSGEPRVVSVTSDGHRLSFMRWDDVNFDGGSTYNRWVAYGQSKTANALFALSLARKLGSKGLQAYSVDPGVILNTGLAAHLDWSDSGHFAELKRVDKSQGHAYGWAPFKPISSEQGAATSLYAAFDQDLKPNNGAYLLECRVGDPYKDTVKPWITSEVEAERLWALSEKLVGQRFEY